MLFNRHRGVLMCLDTVTPPEPDAVPQPNGLVSPIGLALRGDGP